MPVITSGGSLVTSQSIVNGTITNEDINAGAAIAPAKLSDGLVLKVRKSSAQTLGANAQITFDTEVVDTLSAFASNVFTAPRAMRLLAVLNVPITTNESTIRACEAAIRVNSSALRYNGCLTGDAAGKNGGITVIELLSLAQNDTVDATVVGTASQTAAGGSTGTSLTLYEL